jgi:hypothetical protein
MSDPPTSRLDVSGMMPVDQLSDATVEDGDELLELAREAEAFLTEQRWCRKIERGFLDRGIAGVLGVFYFEIDAPQADDCVWVIVGDVPPAYLDVPSCPTSEAALNAYVWCMQEWIDAVRAGENSDETIPILRRGGSTEMPPTTETADLLAPRLKCIREAILPDWPELAPRNA